MLFINKIKMHLLKKKNTIFLLNVALGANVAFGKLTKQSSIYKHFSEYLTSDKAVDGLTSNVIYCAHTLVDTPTFWWGVDLGMEYSIQKIFIYGTSAGIIFSYMHTKK